MKREEGPSHHLHSSISSSQILHSAFCVLHSSFCIPESPMPTPITLPQLSDTMTEGTVVRWLKKEGDKIKAGETIAEVETDKAVMEMEAFEAGTLAAVLVGEGQSAAVGAVIAVLATGKEDPAAIKKQYADGA